MEGNLTRARSSLFVAPIGSLSSIHSSSPLSRSTPSPPTNGQRFSALGVPASKHRQLHTLHDPLNSSPGHARVQSENSISTPTRSAPSSTRFPVRASSAAARYNVRGGTDSSEPSPPLTRTPESPREDSRAGVHSGYSSSLSKTSPGHGSSLEPLNEDGVVPEFDSEHANHSSGLDRIISPFGESRPLSRSTSSMQMRDLRDQMTDLKGRLSVLRDRARDDTMKRRSLQSLRTPSPFTAAEQWYAGSKNYGDSPLSADGGIAQPPWKDQDEGGAETAFQVMNTSEAKNIPHYAESDATISTTNDPRINVEDEEVFDPAGEEEASVEEEDFDTDYNDEIVERDEADDYDSDASLYHDTVAVPISHEDREDAFDYEHFFLHSAMGTISQQRLARRGSASSFSSEDSVETTRGPAAPKETSLLSNEERASLGHFRSESTDSISTVATFATADEGVDSDSEDDEARDNFAVQFVNASPLQKDTLAAAKRSTFGGTFSAVPEDEEVEQSTPQSDDSSSSTTTEHNPRERNGNSNHRPSVSSFDSLSSNGTTRSFPLVNKPKSAGISGLISGDSGTSILPGADSFTKGASDNESPVSMLAREDRILVERLVASLGKCVLGLQEAGFSYEGRVWRRRLDAARRVLEGQEGAV